MRPHLDTATQRKLQRTRLIDARETLGDREQREAALQRGVAEWLQRADHRVVAFYFPVRGEPDLRSVFSDWLALDDGRVAALPVIDGNLLRFCVWNATVAMQLGRFDIPAPVNGHPVQPTCVLVPCVGFDQQRFRLGYGGGYYDRTLASLQPKPIAVGIAFEIARVESVLPQPHDVQLDAVITEAATFA